MDVSTLANWVTILSLPVGAATGWLFFYLPYCRNELATNPEYRLRRAETLRNPRPWRFYLDFLSAGLAFLDRLMGRAASWRALGVCLTLALVYAYGFLLVAWTLGASGVIGGIVLLPEGWTPWPRRLFVLAVLMWSACIGLLLANAERTDAALAPRLRRLLGWFRPGASPGTARWLHRALAALVANTLLVIGGGAITRVAPGTLAGILAGALDVVVVAVSMATASGAGTLVVVAAALFFAAPAAFIFSAEGLMALNRPVTASWFLFFLILPLLNAVWDWWSWSVSRWFGRRLLRAIRAAAPWWRKAGTAVLDVLGDLAAAFGFLLALAFTLPMAIEAYNVVAFAAGGLRPLDLSEYLERAAARPWTDGFWATFMLLSTFLHLVAALASLLLFWFYPTENRVRLAAALSAPEPTPEAYRRAAWHFALHRPLFYLAAALLFGFVVWGVLRLIGQAEPVPQILHDVARAGIATARDVAAILGAPQTPLR